MDEFLFRPKQELDTIGPIYSAKDEVQRKYAEDVRNLRIQITRKLDINHNIEGLEKRKFPGGKNPATLRLWAPLSSIGRKGERYVSHHHNVSRFVVPGFVLLWWYYNAESYIRSTYYSHDLNNCESETAYFKLQTFTTYNTEKSSLMA